MTSARRPTVALLDYGMGNLHSVGKALEVAGADVATTADPEVVGESDGVVLPGVGAFPKAMERLEELELGAAVVAAVERGRPLLGICLGLQLLFESTQEQGGAAGLGILPGDVVELAGEGLKVPHIGWARVDWATQTRIREGIEDGDAFYFVHSFVPVPRSEDLLATACYGSEFACAAGRGTVFGVQFHPEKSSASGLRLLSNFVGIVAEEAAA